MKQIYKKPEMKLYNVGIHRLCSVSDPTTLELNSTKKVGSGTEALGRGGSIWSDED